MLIFDSKATFHDYDGIMCVLIDCYKNNYHLSRYFQQLMY